MTADLADTHAPGAGTHVDHRLRHDLPAAALGLEQMPVRHERRGMLRVRAGHRPGEDVTMRRQEPRPEEVPFHAGVETLPQFLAPSPRFRGQVRTKAERVIRRGFQHRARDRIQFVGVGPKAQPG